MMYSASELSPLGSAAKPKDLESFQAACARCEIKVMLTGHQIRQVEQNLIYDKSKQGVRGRALSKVRVVCCTFESLSLRSPGSFFLGSASGIVHAWDAVFADLPTVGSLVGGGGGGPHPMGGLHK